MCRSSECKQECACWVTYTPDEYSYELVMFEGGGEVQGVWLTRAEFIDLKEQLARSRGLLDSERPAADVK